jgi:hypothetical protein
MNYVLGQDPTQSRQTSIKSDYSKLYEQIGNIVIERAHAGDDYCLRIYERAWKTRDAKN